MKKLMGLILTLSVICMICGLCLNWGQGGPLYQPETYVTSEVADASEVNSHLDAANKRAGLLQDFHCVLSAKVYRRLTFNVEGEMAFSKPMQSNIVFNSRFGREVQIGSNESEFWFYSKRMDQPGLYYARHEDLSRTRLKAPFHPLWLMQGLGLEPLTFSATPRFEIDRDAVKVVAEERGPNGRGVRRVALITTADSTIRGSYLYDGEDALIASVEINDRGGPPLFVPNKLRLVWVHEGEKVVMDVELKNQKTNVGQRERFTRPVGYGRAINMAAE